jgi:hypothetical protein
MEREKAKSRLMLVSTLDRFQGALLGVYIGESLENQPLAPKLCRQSLPRTRFLSCALETDDPAVLLASLDRSVALEEAVILAILPDLLSGYETPERWRQRLDSFASAWSLSAIADARLWGTVLSRLLSARLPLENQIFPELEPILPTSAEGLSLLHSEGQLTRAATPHQRAIAIALHSCLQTPGDSSISIRCAFSSSCQQPLTTILAGIGTGFSNGLTGFPLAWRLSKQNDPLWQNLARQAIELYGIWSGVDPMKISPLPAAMAIAPAGTLQPRPNFRPVSREDF